MKTKFYESAATGSVDALVAELLPSARAMLGMEVAFVSEFCEGRRVFRHVDANKGFEPIQVNGSELLEDSYCQRVVDGRIPELMQDAKQNFEALKLPPTLALPVGAYLSVPIKFRSGRVFGTFCCFSRQADESLGERDLATMRFFAEILSKVIEDKESAEATARLIHARVRHVLDKGLFAFVYQPIFDISRNKVVGYEALARFQSEPYRPPNEWLADADAAGLLAELETALITTALSQVEDLASNTYLSLNVTPATVTQENFARLFAAYPLERLVLEITEHDSVSDYEAIILALEPLRRQGLRLAIDDVGAGYANFRHILKLKPDIIKLDRALMQNIDSEIDGRSLTAAMIQFSKEFGCAVIAEGIETQAELATLRKLGVELAQGYLLGRPRALLSQLASTAVAV